MSSPTPEEDLKLSLTRVFFTGHISYRWEWDSPRNSLQICSSLNQAGTDTCKERIESGSDKTVREGRVWGQIPNINVVTALYPAFLLQALQSELPPINVPSVSNWSRSSFKEERVWSLVREKLRQSR